MRQYWDACSVTGIPVPTAEHWDTVDYYGFKRRKAWAAQIALGKLEAEIHSRVIEGVDHPVIHQGVITDTYKQYSDNLLMFRTKRLDPEYRGNYSDKRESGATPVTQIIINLAPGVEMSSQIIEGESREIPEGDES